MPPANATLRAVVIDCADPAALAEFYRKLTGLDIGYSDDTYVDLGAGPVKVGFQRIEGYRARAGPTRPSTCTWTSRSPTWRAPPPRRWRAAPRREFQPGGESWSCSPTPRAIRSA